VFDSIPTGGVDCGKNRRVTLAARLAEWRDWDSASFELGVVLGLFEDGDWPKHKGTVWSANPVGEALSDMLLALTRAGVLERREEPDVAFRWSTDPRA
jgi:hypothetical protein